MTDINDPTGILNKLDRELDNLEEAEIPEADKNAIQSFLNHLQANKDNKPRTNGRKIGYLRRTSQRAHVSLVEMDKDDLDSFTVECQRKHDISKPTLNNYKATWRPFFGELGRDWAEDIEFFDTDDDEVEAWKVFTSDEVDAMLEEATGRTVAVIAVLADTGSRITALLSIPLGNADLKGQVPVLTLNEHAPTKGAEGNLPLTFSRAYLASYIRNDHPRSGRDDVALFHKKEQFSEDDDGACHYDTIRTHVKDVMKEVGIEERRRKMHHFRHTAITRWKRMGIQESVIQHRTKWADMGMLDKYSHLVEEDKDEMTAEAFGLIDPDDTDDTSRPEDALGDCPVCQTTIRSAARFCPGCGNPIDIEAAEDVPPEGLQEPEETAEDLADMDGVLDEMGTAAVIERLLQQNPALLDSLDFDLGD